MTTNQTPSVQQALHDLLCAYDAAPVPQITALIAAVRAEGAAQIEPHDCEAWAMEGIGCANCNPASPQAWQARAEAAEAKLTEAGHRSLAQGERLIEWRTRAEAAEAENQRLRAANQKILLAEAVEAQLADLRGALDQTSAQVADAPIPLSERVRPHSEAAPWVVEAIRALEARVERMTHQIAVLRAAGLEPPA